MRLRAPGPWGNSEPDRSPRRVRPDNEIRSGLYGLARILKDAVGDWNGPATVPTPAPVLHALGEALHRIANGEDARHVFGQNARQGRQSLKLERGTVAAIYWHEQVKGATATEAAKRAATHAAEHFGMKLTQATVRQYAKRNARVYILGASKNPAVTSARPAEVIAATQAKLLARSAKGTKRGRW